MKLPNNDNIVFNETEHSYFSKSKNNYLIGVTSLMAKHGLGGNYDNIPKGILDNAIKRGKDIHADVQIGELTGNYATEEGYNFRLLKGANDIKVVKNEYLVSDNEMLATMIDIVCEIGGEVVLADIKTTYSFNKEYLQWQLSLCAKLFEEQTGIEVDKLYGIWLRGHKCKLIQIQRLPDETVLALLDAEKNGLIYQPKEITLSLDTSIAIAELSNIEMFIVEQELLLKDLKEKKERMCSIIETSFEENDVKKWETDTVKITRVLPTTSTTFDSKKLLEEHPEFKGKYDKISNKKGFIKITLK